MTSHVLRLTRNTQVIVGRSVGPPRKRNAEEASVFASLASRPYTQTFEISNIDMHDDVRKFKASFFQGLAHPTRIAIVESLRGGELSTGTLVSRLNLEQANASQHLAILRARHVVSSRRQGNQVFYSVRDPRILEVLDMMRRYFQSHLKEEMSLLRSIRARAR